MRVASKVGNLPSKFGHARPLGSLIIRHVCDGRTDRQTYGQKQRLLPPPLRAGHNKVNTAVKSCDHNKETYSVCPTNLVRYQQLTICRTDIKKSVLTATCSIITRP